MNFNNRFRVAVLVIAVGTAPYAISQEIEEITVTAQKRTESLQDVPVAITALSEQALADMGAQSFQDYARFMPSLSFLSRGDGNSTMQVRGVSPPGFGTQATTAVYFDETPVGSQFGQPDLPVVDVERVELLRGPQGTLFGEGSIGGTLRIITNKPSLDSVTLSGLVETSSTDEGDTNFDGSLVVNIPLGDKVAFRASGATRQLSGWIDGAGNRIVPASIIGDLALGDLENLNERDISAYRAALRFEPIDALTIDLMYMYTSIDGEGVDVDINDPTVLSPGFQPQVVTVGQYRSDFATRNYRYDDYDQTSLTVTWDVPIGEVTSTTSWFTRDLDELAEQPGYGFFANANGWSFYLQDDEYVSHETRIASTGDGPLTWIAGVFYRDRDIRAYSEFGSTYLYDTATALGVPNQTDLLYFYELPTRTTFEHTAVFGSVTYALSERLDVTLGLRWFEEKQTSDAQASSKLCCLQEALAEAVANGTDVNAPYVPDAATAFATKENDVSPRLNVTYDVDESWMLYGTVAEGFRSGGVNRNPATDRVTGEPLPDRQAFESDSLWNYEVGSKNTLLDGRMILNTALYLIKWDNIQVPGVIDGVQQRWVTNAGEAESKGFEAEFRLNPASGWWVDGSISYTDAELSKPAIGQPEGTPLPQVAPWKYALAVQYEFPVFGQMGRVRADYSYIDDQPQNLSMTSPINPAYSLVNLRAAYEAERWTLELFAENLTNEYASLGIDPGYLGRFHNRPRTIGASFRFDLMR